MRRRVSNDRSLQIASSSETPTLHHTPTRGRPTRAYAEQVGQTILTTAEALFQRDGFDLVTMETVATLAQISKGTLYARYADKRALYLAVMTAKLAPFDQWSQQIRPDDYPSFAVWFETFAEAMADALTYPAFVAFERFLGAEAFRFPELISEFHRSAYDANSQANLAAINAAAKAFGVRLQDPAFLSGALRSLLWGWARLMPEAEATPMNEIARRGARLLLDGAMAPPLPDGGI